MRPPANTNGPFKGAHGLVFAVDEGDAAKLRLADARRFYAEEGALTVETELRASPDFAPAFAEPGEMDQQIARESELEEAIAYRLLLVALALSVVGLGVVLGLAISRGGL